MFLLSSSTSSTTLGNSVASPSNDSLSLSSPKYPLYVAPESSDFKHALSSQEHMSPPEATGGVLGGQGRQGHVGKGGTSHGTGGGMISGGGGGSAMETKGSKNDFSSELLPQSFHNAQDSNNLMVGLPMQLEPPLQGLGHNPGMSSSATTETFRNLLSSQDDSSLQPDHNSLRLRYSNDGTDGESGGIGAAARSLSHPNLTTIPPRALPRVTQQSSAAVPTHSQAPIPFPASLGGFTLSSMVGHFTSHPHLQAQSLSMNPAVGGLMQGLGISIGSNQTQPPPISNTLAQSLSLSNPAMPGLLGGTSNPSISIMNPPASLNAGASRANLTPNSTTTLPMPLTHHIAGNLQNPAGLPLIPGMPNMYSYPYTLPTQPVTTSIVHTNAPGFPSQSFVPTGYSQYLSPSLYGNAPQQPPVSTEKLF